MKQLSYMVTFNTPAFLGNAEQTAQWRTPPFKALLRHWWRIVYAAQHAFPSDIDKMRQVEGALFGNAWLKDPDGKEQFCKSQIRIRLSHWKTGTLHQWEALSTVQHPEVMKKVGSDLYLGFGPLEYKRQTQLKKNAAIQVTESAKLSLAVPDQFVEEITMAVWLMNQYGTIGGRSRNGWGSLSLAPVNNTPELTGSLPARNWRDAMALNWPHAFGLDQNNKPLIWQTASSNNWQDLMRSLAIIKISLRTQFLFHTGKNARQPEPRHWLSYPVTHHNVSSWRNIRIPNTLRFKIQSDSTDSTKLRGMIFHIPHLPAKPARSKHEDQTLSRSKHDQTTIEQTWEQVHSLLDELTKQAPRPYRFIADPTRRETLSSNLKHITLERVYE